MNNPKGYSFTVPIINIYKAPTHGGIDEDNLLAFSLMGDEIRFTSVAEISGYDTNWSPSDFTEMVQLAEGLSHMHVIIQKSNIGVD